MFNLMLTTRLIVDDRRFLKTIYFDKRKNTPLSYMQSKLDDWHIKLVSGHMLQVIFHRSQVACNMPLVDHLGCWLWLVSGMHSTGDRLWATGVVHRLQVTSDLLIVPSMTKFIY